MHAAVNAIVEKSSYASDLLFTTLFTAEMKDIDNLNEDLKLTNVYSDYVDKILKEIVYLNGMDEKDEHPLKIILDLINTSVSDENLAKMAISWNPWF